MKSNCSYFIITRKLRGDLHLKLQENNYTVNAYTLSFDPA